MVDDEERFAHVFGRISFKELLAEPDLETRVVFLLQLVALFAHGLHLGQPQRGSPVLKTSSDDTSSKISAAKKSALRLGTSNNKHLNKI